MLVTIIFVFRVFMRGIREGIAGLEDVNGLVAAILMLVYVFGSIFTIFIVFYMLMFINTALVMCVNEVFSLVSLNKPSSIVSIGILEIYFLPLTVSYFYRKPNTLSTGVLNLFFGWTLIGWVISMKLALAQQQENSC